MIRRTLFIAVILCFVLAHALALMKIDAVALGAHTPSNVTTMTGD
jgi:hypothetical protein